MFNQEYHLRTETEAARALLAALAADAFAGTENGEADAWTCLGARLEVRDTLESGDDAILRADTIEGETDLFEAIDLTLDEIDEVELLITGIRDKEAQFRNRRKGMEARIAHLRALIEQAMAVTDLATVRRPAATLSLKNLPPQVIVTSEADIPSDFFVPQPPPPPKLDLKALKAALMTQAAQGDGNNAGSATPLIAGAMLSNGSKALQIRRAS